MATNTGKTAADKAAAKEELTEAMVEKRNHRVIELDDGEFSIPIDYSLQDVSLLRAVEKLQSISNKAERLAKQKRELSDSDSSEMFHYINRIMEIAVGTEGVEDIEDHFRYKYGEFTVDQMSSVIDALFREDPNFGA